MFLGSGDIFDSDADAVFLRRADVLPSMLLFESFNGLRILSRIIAPNLGKFQREYMAPGQQLLRLKARWNR